MPPTGPACPAKTIGLSYITELTAGRSKSASPARSLLARPVTAEDWSAPGSRPGPVRTDRTGRTVVRPGSAVTPTEP